MRGWADSEQTSGTVCDSDYQHFRLIGKAAGLDFTRGGRGFTMRVASQWPGHGGFVAEVG